MKRTVLNLHKILAFGFFALCVGQTSAQEAYRFNCRDYISTDDNRAPQSAFSYDDDANTFTITASGTNNIAFKMDIARDMAYYIPNSKDWFLVEGTNLNLTYSYNYIWWFNGFNNNGQTPATYTASDGNGKSVILWDIKNTPAINGMMDYSNKQIFISSNGKAFIHAMGLTSTTGTSTISNINYYAKYEAAATYPMLISALGYTTKTLTDEIKSQLNTSIDVANEAIKDDPESESKEKVEKAISDAQALFSTAGEEEYDKFFSTLHSLNTALDAYEAAVLEYSFSQKETGFQGVLNGLYTNVTLYADDIVRVCKSYDQTITKKSWSVIDTPDISATFNVTEDKDAQTVTLTTDKIKVVYHQTTAQIEVMRADGTKLINEKEKSHKFFDFNDGGQPSYQISQGFTLEDDESIYGMGQIQDGKLNRRNCTFSLAQENRSVCIPYFHSTRNYALFWDNYSPTTFTDNAEGTSFQSTGREIDYYIMAGENGKDVLAGMRELTGQSPMPALWNFGLYQSKERYVSADETMGVVQQYRDLGVPLDCIVQDWQYWGDDAHWNALEFLNPSFSNYEQLIQNVHDNNAKLMISIWANFGPSTAPYNELNGLGRLIPVESYPTGKGVRPYDVYGEGARDIYWKYLYNGLVSKGIDAYWMDSSEPDYFNWKPEDLNYMSECGQTWRALRNAFPLAHVSGVHDHHRAAEANGDTHLAGKRVSILTRSAFAGQQRYGANTWSADITSSWETLAAQIPAACNLSACGIPYWNSDTGGFFIGGYKGVGDAAWRRLYMRWVQFSTFCPMMRFHGTQTPREIYQFGRTGDGEGDFDHTLKYIKMRYRMLPYLYSTAWQICKHDATFMEALPVAFTSDPQTHNITDEYMFGDAFLVAPVVVDKATERNVYLPAGEKWVDFWTGNLLDGGQTITKQAHADIIPLYVKAGSILPWGPDVQYSTEKNWDNLEIRVYPGANGSFTLYEDENDGYNYEDGKYTEIPFTWDDATETLTIGARQGDFEGMLKERTFRICKVSPRRGTGDLHETHYDATITYDGTVINLHLTNEDQVETLTDITVEHIQNPSFEANNGTLTKVAPIGWTTDCTTTWWGVNTGGGNGDPTATDGKYIFGVWDGGTTASARISQEITLNAGNYRLTVDMHAPSYIGMNRVGGQRLFAGDNTVYFKNQILYPGTSDTDPLQTITLDFNIPTDNTSLSIGVNTSDAPNQTWYKVDNFRLYAVTRPVLALNEEETTVPTTGGITDVVVNRKLKAANWNTLCLPFDLTDTQMAENNISSCKKLISNTEAENNTILLQFENVSNMTAGEAYIVKVSEDMNTLQATDVDVKWENKPTQTEQGVSMQGNYARTFVPQSAFFIKDDCFWRADQENAIELKGYRAYITLPNEGISNINKLLLSLNDDVTSVDKILKNEESRKLTVHTLSGCLIKNSYKNKEELLKSLPSGIYIVNGEKIIK